MGQHRDQQQHDPLVAELIGQGGGERPTHEARGREQQAAEQRPVDGAGHQEVLIGPGSVGVGKLDRHPECVRQRLGQANTAGEGRLGGTGPEQGNGWAAVIHPEAGVVAGAAGVQRAAVTPPGQQGEPSCDGRR
jgi:hypothetical protein